MPIGHGRIATKGRPLENMVHLKRSIVEVKAEENYLAHALIISIAKLTNVSDYKHFVREERYVPLWIIYLRRQVLSCQMAEEFLS